MMHGEQKTLTVIGLGENNLDLLDIVQKVVYSLTAAVLLKFFFSVLLNRQ